MNAFNNKGGSVACRAVIAIAACAALTAQAQTVVFDETFDPISANGVVQAGYKFGDTTTDSSGVVAGIGVGGTAGWQTVDTAASGPAFCPSCPVCPLPPFCRSGGPPNFHPPSSPSTLALLSLDFTHFREDFFFSSSSSSSSSIFGFNLTIWLRLCRAASLVSLLSLA
ncbi:MAG TPA: hypothetical protein VGY56_00350 [Verrucomicrobiae bacterium]|nr:hypothetical protein [Verrucomicrobiae bacterium]